MFDLSALPSIYSPYRTLEFCSNRLDNILVPIAVGDHPILLVGKGQLPLVWLAAPSEPGSQHWDFVVKESKSTNSALQVKYDRQERTVQVTFGTRSLLIARSKTDAVATVDQVDLRPLGLSVEGDKTGLSIGGMRMAHNTFASMQVAFAFSDAASSGPALSPG